MGKYDEELYKFLGNNERFADLFNGIYFQGKPVILPEDLSELSEREPATRMDKMGQVTRSTYRDLKKKWRDKGTLRILGVENQSEVDYTMPWRIMNYDCAEYEKQIRSIKHKNKIANYQNKTRSHKDDSNKDDSNNTDSKFSNEISECRDNSLASIHLFNKTDHLNPVFTLCLYHGEKRWDGPIDLRAMMTPVSLEPLKLGTTPMMIPFQNYAINLIDVNDFENPDYFKTSLRELFKILQVRKDRKQMRNLLETDKRFHRLDKEAMQVIGTMIHHKYILEQMDRFQIEEGDNYNMCKAFEDERMEGRIQQAVECFFQFGKSKDEILIYLQNKFSMSEKEAAAAYEEYAPSLVV